MIATDRWQRLSEAGQQQKESSAMNVVLWILQVALAVPAVAGGAYKLMAYNDFARTPAAAALSRGAWGALGVFEVVCGLLLVVPAAPKWRPIVTPAAAAALALESLFLAGLDARYSLELTAANPLVWVLGMGLTAAFVAYGRYALRPA